MTILLSRSSAADDPTPFPADGAAAEPATKPTRWRAFDGMRALAVAAVVLYHAGVRGVSGGTLGVDIFFVLSGYLITSLLLREAARRGRISLRAFWTRRVRRLFPALLVVLLAVLAWACYPGSPSGRGDLSSTRLDVLSSLCYVANWRFAWSQQSYFTAGEAPSPVLHLWSLGIEEQFYLVWPLLVGGALWLAARRRISGRTVVGLLACLLTIGSTSTLVIKQMHHVDVSRLYYGTDTRALALLVGAVAACLTPLPTTVGAFRRRSRAWSVSGWLGLAVLTYLVAGTGGQDEWLYRGGFLVVAGLVGFVLTGIARSPGGSLSRSLSVAPLAHLGRISYPLYLWHWPVNQVITAGRTGTHGVGLMLLRIGISVLLAENTFWFLEQPIQEGRWRWTGGGGASWLQGARGRRLVSVTAVVAAVGLLAAGLLAPISSRTRPTAASVLTAPESLLQARQAQHFSMAEGQAGSSWATPPTAGSTGVPREPLRTLLVGDSLAFTASIALQNVAPSWKVDLFDASRVGCGIAPGVGAGDGDQAPVGYGECWDWPVRWAKNVSEVKPAAVLIVLGRWEVVDRRVNGQVMRVGDPVYDDMLRREMRQAISILSADGAKAMFATAPCFQRPERADGTYYPQDDCARVQRFNELIREAVDGSAGRAGIVDLYNFVSPDGRFHSTINGQVVRDPDGVHLALDGGSALAPTLLGELRAGVGLPARPPGAK